MPLSDVYPALKEESYLSAKYKKKLTTHVLNALASVCNMITKAAD